MIKPGRNKMTQDKNKKFLVEWAEGYGDAPSKIVSLYDIKAQDEWDSNLLRDSGVLDELECSENEVVTYSDPSGEVVFRRIMVG
tara:strand:+ start:4651 stop:4902 length:252 start_codon:yes stop_codon:yes gene_type:complete